MYRAVISVTIALKYNLSKGNLLAALILLQHMKSEHKKKHSLSWSFK